MAEFPGDEAPLPSLEDFLIDGVDDLEVSIGQFSIEEHEARTSTPKVTRSLAEKFNEAEFGEGERRGKHDLTPTSKMAILPQAKRFEVGGKPSGREVKERKARLESVLKEGFEFKEGAEVKVQSVLAYVGCDDNSQKLVSRTLKEIFPGVSKRREDKQGLKQAFYVNLAMRCNIASLMSREGPDIFNDELADLLQNLQASEQVMCQVWSALVAANMQGKDVSVMISEYTREAQARDKLLKTLICQYEAEINRLRSGFAKDHLSDEQKLTVKEEIKLLERLCNSDIRDGSAQEAYDSISTSIFREFTQEVQKRCPLIHEVVEALVISNHQERNVHKTNSHKMVCGLQTLAFMVNIRNSRARNCFPLMFGLLCISYGAGKEFVDMLQSMGLSLHWNTIMMYLDKRLFQYQELINGCAPPSVPVILLLDNINLYHGNRRHHRLFKLLGPKMWNFTVRGLLVPKMDTIEHLFQSKETAEESQCSEELKADDTFIESHPEHLRVWNEVQDNYLLQLMDKALNCIPESEKKLADMDEREFGHWLQKQDLSQKPTKTFDIKVPEMSIKSNKRCSKSETLILPLSLENNATTTGTAAIVEQFGKEFGVPCEHAKEYLPFDQKNQHFDIEAARRHQEFLASLADHKKEMQETVHQLTEAEKGFEMLHVPPEMDESFSSGDLQGGGSSQKEDGKLQKVFDSLVKRMWDAQQSSDLAQYSSFINELASQRASWENIRDHHGRTVLLKAVENGNMLLVKTLLCAGVDVNVKEKCGATPLTLAVINKNEEMCAYLLENFAVFDSHFFSTIPSPYALAVHLNLEAAKIMDEKAKQNTDIDSFISEIFQEGETDTALENNENVDSIDVEPYRFNRKKKSCQTLFVGDQGTLKVLRGVKSRSEAAYGWCAEVPGDMHTKGYLYEVCKKVMKPGGFMHILCNVLSRTKINDDSFGQKKFQEQNLNRIEEAVRDMGVSFGMAAVLEFRDSSSLPSKDELNQCKRKTGSHSLILLQKFKEWISSSSEDMAFKYYEQMFTLFGPLQQMYSNSIRFGCGLAREASWMLMHPLFAQSNKRNYHTEAMVHVVNFVAAWPLALRELLRKNCSISLTGKDGHNLALDEWVESCVVQPMKNYSTGHTTVKMLQRLMANIDLFDVTRDAYHSRDAFNVHSTTRHCEQDPFPDQIKATSFILKQGFVTPDTARKTVQKFNDPQKGLVSNSNIDAYAAGKKKVQETFNRKLFSLYGIFNAAEDEDRDSD